MLQRIRTQLTPFLTTKDFMIFVGMLLLGTLITSLYAYGHKADGDVTQMFDKVISYFQDGKIVPYGPASASGSTGHVPGSFLTLALVLPMKVWFSIWAPLVFLWFLHLSGFLFLASVMKNYLGPLSFFFLTLMFWINPYRASEVFLWNPSYMFFTGCFHLWTLYHWQRTPNLIWSTLHTLSLFLGVQIHPSVVILVGVSAIFFFINLRSVSLKRVLPGVLLGAALGLATLIPFFIEVARNPEVMPQAGNDKGYLFYGLLHVFPVLKSFWYWILFGSFISQTHVFHKTGFSWIGTEGLRSFAEIVFLVSRFAVGAFGVLLSFYLNFRVWKWVKHQNPKWTDWSKFSFPIQYLSAAFVMNLVFNAISPTTPQYWHVLYVFPSAVISVALGLQILLDQRPDLVPRVTKGLVLLGFYFTLFNLFAARESHKYNWNKSLPETFLEYSLEKATPK